MTDKVKQIKVRRGQIKSELTRFQTYLSKFVPSAASLTQLETRFDSIRDIFNEFKTVQSDLEAELSIANDLDEELAFQDREEFETKYYNAISQAKDLLKSLSPQTSANASSDPQVASNTNPSSSAKLPALKIPEFSGSYSEWQRFHDTFKAIVHDNNILQNIEKFYYLQSSLKGEASQVIASLPISGANYLKAFELLQQRYENRKAIINSHLKEIFDLPTIPKESHYNLRKFNDTFLKNYRALESLKEPIDKWDTILIYLLVSKLDFASKKEWENCIKTIDHPSLTDFTTFLSQRCQMLEVLYSKPNLNRTSSNSQSFYANEKNSNTIPSCPFCSENHYIYFCSKFKGIPIEARLNGVKSMNLCTNCLRKGHKVHECRSKGCRICNSRHNSLLHVSKDLVHGGRTSKIQERNFPSNINMPQTMPEDESSDVLPPVQNPSGQVTLNHFVHKSAEPYVLLSTALVYVTNSYMDEPVVCRVLLDCGSQSNFISRSLIERLRLPTRKINIPVCGINQIKTNINEQTEICISSMHNKFKVKISCLIIDKISDFSPQESFNASSLNIPDLPLADPNFNISSNVDILIGCSLFFNLLLAGQLKLGKNLPVLQNSQFGWIIAGNIPRGKQQFECFFTQTSYTEINNQLEKFWNIEEVLEHKTDNLSSEELKCENHFIENISRNHEGRFIAKLPLKDNFFQLGESEHQALNRLYALEQRLSKNPELNDEYHKFLLEYRNLNHMKEISRDDISSTPIYYLPHHCVSKPDSLTTKIRVVFNASAKTSTNLSLNDVLMDGPVIQNDLFSILLRFRKHEIVLIGDLTKMYRQILVHPDHTNLQRIVWRETPNQEVKYFALQTLTYGTKPASFIATRCLKQIALENFEKFPQECDIILNDMYMDDVLTGCSNASDMMRLRENITNLLSSYGFEMRKFQSNNSQVLENLCHTNDSQYIITDDTATKTLGVSWVPSSDMFQYKGQFLSESKSITKRTILSFIAKIFDPLGLIGPILIRAKLLMQTLWLLRLEWDDPVPTEISNQWLKLKNHISQIHIVQIPRHVLLNLPINLQIHAFSDASERAYAGAIYIRSVDKNRNIQCHLLCAKSRVAPLKTISLPRLELCGALLVSRLLSKCLKAMDLSINRIYCYTDSTIVLSWIAREPKFWKTFVSNRVAEIRNLTNVSDWFFISSSQNPADIISRGADLEYLTQSNLWWHGPSFLLDNKEHWPSQSHISSFSRSPDKILEFRSQRVTFLCNDDSDFNIINRYSNYNKLIRVTAFCLRFINNIKSRLKPRLFSSSYGFLDNDERKNSINCLVKIVQKISFPKELDCLQRNKPISSKSYLKSLSPILCPDGLIRVGGRLEKGPLSYNQIHPIIIPYKHHFTRLVISYEHNRCLHAGVNVTLSHVRQNFWPIHGKMAVKSCIRKCIKCFRAKPPSLSAKMGQLPSSRVTPSYPFLSTSVDFAGPFELKDGKTRNRKIIKAYICVFVCHSTKAVHLELISDLTSDGFLSLLKRFVSRRGLCSDLYSDNATNFTGANNEIKSIQNLTKAEFFQDYLNKCQINWHFIPARSPHFGGLHEAAVKSCKHHLKRVLNQHPLTYEEFYSVLSQVEAVLNSRPLVPLSSSPDDFEALTPAHFLIGRPLTAVPQRDLMSTKVNHIKRYHYMQQIFQSFWSRWIKEYLHTLHQRSKWQFEKHPQVTIGSMVLLKEENVPPLYWPLGRVLEVHPGDDGIVRVVTVKTKTSVLKRSVTKLSLLPFHD